MNKLDSGLADGPRIVIFLGPTLERDAVAAAFAGTTIRIDVRPPVQRGDVLRLLSDPPNVIAIIDGYFLQRPAVLHKEILLAIEQGIRVIGAASMGALRAAELDTFGMEGIGEVYRMYRAGTIIGDDEVAVLHTIEEGSFRALTIPLINIRYNLRQARIAGALTAALAAAALATAKRIHFTERTVNTILNRLEMQGTESAHLRTLRQYLGPGAADLKRLDASRLLRTLRMRLTEAEAWPKATLTGVHHTKYLHMHQRDYSGPTVGNLQVPDPWILACDKLLNPYFQRMMEIALRRRLAISEWPYLGVSEINVDELLCAHWRGLNYTKATDKDSWLQQRYLSLGELISYLQDREREKTVLQAFRRQYPEANRRCLQLSLLRDRVAVRLGVPPSQVTRPPFAGVRIPWESRLVQELKFSGRYRVALFQAVRILATALPFVQALGGERIPISDELVLRWVTKIWRTSQSRLADVAIRRGFLAPEELLNVARLAYFSEARALFGNMSSITKIGDDFSKLL